MGMMQEFKEFAIKGNVMDLAVGVIIGGAFGKIVDSLVKDIIMPIVGKIFGGLDFSNFFIKLAEGPAGIPQTYADLTKAGVPLFAYGNFITILINFLILAFIIFQMVKAMNRMKREKPSGPPPAPPEDITLLREIRDALKR
jgi:large conductance mechanosensitive channel